ncbi:MAG: hypothetical protein SVM80_07585 [Halobacteriota archaeon]|nr:hypothetical protein [Halobacteriota archaeon]
MRQVKILDDAGQMFTIEGFLAAMIIALVLILSIQATSITPLTSSAANQHVEAQLQFIGQDILTSLDYGSDTTISPLAYDILNWNGSQYVWNGTDYVKVYDESEVLNNALTETLNFTLLRKGVAHNIELFFINNATGALVTDRMIYNGDPSDNAVTVSHKLILHDENVNGDFYSLTGIGDMDSTTDFYNLVDVSLTMWRM